VYVRQRNLDLRLLLDGYDKRRRGFMPLTTFRRALACAFSQQWLELAMTTAEFQLITEPYLTRKPVARGDPEACIMWRMFANDLNNYAGDVNENEAFFARTTKTIKQRVEYSSAMTPMDPVEREHATREAFAGQCGFADDYRREHP